MRFQSSPFPKEGRYPNHIIHRRLHHVVSILALPEGRALHCEARICVLIGPVSILALPEGRALRHIRPCMQPGPFVSILALPEGRALRTGQVNPDAARLFQSSPFPKEGRYGRGPPR